MRASSGLVLCNWLLDVATRRFVKHSCVHFVRKSPSPDMSSTYFLFFIQEDTSDGEGDPNPSWLQSPFPNSCMNMRETAQASMTNTENCNPRWKSFYSEGVTRRTVAPHYISSSFLLHGVPLDTRWEGLRSASLAAERQSTVLGEKHYIRWDTIENREPPITLCAILPSRLWITAVCADCVCVTERVSLLVPEVHSFFPSTRLFSAPLSCVRESDQELLS